MTTKIILSTGNIAFVDDEDYERLAIFKWNLVRSKGHLYASYNRIVLMHRLIMNLTDTSLRVDHKDNDGLNNRKSNLRVCTQGQNLQNMDIRNQVVPKTSRFKGVYWYGQRQSWHVRVKRKHVGYYKDEVEAARAYDAKALEMFGEFAKTNEMLGLI